MDVNLKYRSPIKILQMGFFNFSELLKTQSPNEIINGSVFGSEIIISIWDEMVHRFIGSFFANHQYLRWDDSEVDRKRFQIISFWDEIVQRFIGVDFKSSVFEMRCFVGYVEGISNHQFLRWDGSAVHWGRGPVKNFHCYKTIARG